MNTNYCRIVKPAATAITYAPDFLVRADGSINHSPTRADYAAQNWSKNAVRPPSPPEGYVVSSTTYAEQGEPPLREIVAVYAYEPAPVVPRKWTRLKMKTAIAAKGWLVTIKTMLSGIEIETDYNALEAFTDCDYVEEFWPNAERWGQFLDAAAATVGKPRAEIDAFLDTVPTDPGATATEG